MNIIGLYGESSEGIEFVENHLCDRGFVSWSLKQSVHGFLTDYVTELTVPAMAGLLGEPVESFVLKEKFLHDSLFEEVYRWGKKIHPGFWISFLQDWMKDYADPTDFLVITDITEEYEANWIHKHGQLWHVPWDGPAHFYLPDAPVIINFGIPQWVTDDIDFYLEKFLSERNLAGGSA